MERAARGANGTGVAYPPSLRPSPLALCAWPFRQSNRHRLTVRGPAARASTDRYPYTIPSTKFHPATDWRLPANSSPPQKPNPNSPHARYKVAFTAKDYDFACSGRGGTTSTSLWLYCGRKQEQATTPFPSHPKNAKSAGMIRRLLISIGKGGKYYFAFFCFC